MAEPRILSEDMEDVEDFADLEVHSVVDLIPVVHEMLDAERAGISGLFDVVTAWLWHGTTVRDGD